MDGHYQRTVTIFDWKIEFGMLECFETNFLKNGLSLKRQARLVECLILLPEATLGFGKEENERKC